MKLDTVITTLQFYPNRDPKMRFFVQENWLPWDHYEVNFKAPQEKVDHNAPTGESLRKLHAPYYKAIDEHVAELNMKHQTKAVRVAPVGQAVIFNRTDGISLNGGGFLKFLSFPACK